MKIPLDLINGIRVASPCPASWEQMTGNGRVRYCSLCNQRVYDLSTMSGAEVATFLGAHDEDVCVRFYRRADGTVMTRDCPKGASARMTAWVSWATVAAMSVLGFLLFRGWSSSPLSTTKVVPAGGPRPAGRTMGKLCIPKDPPRRQPNGPAQAANDDLQ